MKLDFPAIRLISLDRIKCVYTHKNEGAYLEARSTQSLRICSLYISNKNTYKIYEIVTKGLEYVMHIYLQLGP